MSDWTVGSENLRPIRRLASKTVLAEFNEAWFLADSPISLSLVSASHATHEGVIRFPSSFGIISTLPFFQIPTQD